MGGWGIIVADVIVMANLAADRGRVFVHVRRRLRPAGRSRTLANNIVRVDDGGSRLDRGDDLDLLSRHRDLGAAAVRAALHSSASILILFAVFALVRVYTGNASRYSLIPQLDWFNPFTLDFGRRSRRPCSPRSSSTGAGTPPSR